MEKKNSGSKVGVKLVGSGVIAKAENALGISGEAQATATEWMEPPSDLRGLKVMVGHSSILPQCIRAYKNNIAGFGIGVRYKEDFAEETAEMIAEYERAERIISLLSLEADTKEVFENIIEARETYGIAYAEVIRNGAGEVSEINFIKDTVSIRKTYPLEPYITTVYFYKGESGIRKKKFCKYKQQIGGKTVFFKELGDSRVMDCRDGRYLDEGESLADEFCANEILEFALGTAAYGEVRWIGQCLGIDGSRRAESLNNRYFTDGRHTPLMLIVKGGTLTEESFDKLRMYMDGVKGESGQHSFMVLEAESTDGATALDSTALPEVEIKDMASILQKDELFQEYLENNRRKAQSAFQLPDLYVGYTTDFNRATAQTAMEVTEKQVFQPERKSLAWIINNKLLGEFGFKYVEAYFMEPDISNVEDLARILNITERAGGLTPNKAKEIAYSFFGETAENYEGDWANLPIKLADKI